MRIAAAPDEAFDDVVDRVTRICAGTKGIVGLVDSDRQWVGPAEVGPTLSLCAHVALIEGSGPIEDLKRDVIGEHPLAQDAQDVRSLAAVPMVDPRGSTVGLLAAFSDRPRRFTDAEVDALNALGARVASELPLRRRIWDAELRALRLQASEDRLSALVETLPLGVVLADDTGVIRVWNGAAGAIFGHATEDAVGQPVTMLVAEKDRALLEAALRAGSQASTMRFTGVRQSGREVLLEISFASWWVRGEECAALVFRDASRRAAAEQVTRTLGRALDLDEGVGNAFKDMCGALGWEAVELWTPDANDRLSCSHGWHTSDAAFVVRGDALAGRVWQSGEPKWDPRGLGIPIHIRDRVFGVLAFLSSGPRDPDYEMVQTLAPLGAQVGHFIERWRAHEHLSATIDNMLDALVVTTPEGTICSVNPAAETMFGRAMCDLVGTSLGALVAGQPPALDLIGASLAKTTEWTGLRHDGDEFPFEMAMYEFETPHGSFFASHVRDLSHRHEVDRMKREFVSIVSHELRTPLTSIRGALGLLEQGVVGTLHADAQELVTIARENSERLIRLINDILDIEKIEAGKLDIRRALLEPSAVVESALGSVRGMASECGVRLVAHISESREVSGDLDRIVQVLVNLLSNAIKFSDEGGEVRVDVSVRDGRVRFSVRDHGTGVPPEKLDLLFQKFQQIDSSDRRRKDGTGLGLAICKAIIDLHHGDIGVQSSPDEGSTFWFEL